MPGAVYLGTASCAFLVVGLFASESAAPFGPSGHRIAGHVAEHYLCPEARRRIEPLLAGASLADAGLWPDTIRSVPEWEHSKAWHFINVADGESVASAARASEDNVLSALARFEQQLGDERVPVRQRGIALRFVAHFVVDIHQPLHVGRAGDRGGNTIEVLLGGERSSLHAVWDAEALLSATRLRTQEYARRLVRSDARQARRWQAANPVAWAEESLALRPLVYALWEPDPQDPEPMDPDPMGSGPAPVAGLTVLRPAYLARALAVIDERLNRAGIRLAGRLNAALGCRAR